LAQLLNLAKNGGRTSAEIPSETNHRLAANHTGALLVGGGMLAVGAYYLGRKMLR